MFVASTRERIDRWLGELLATGIESDSVTIALVHAAVDQGQRTVRTWRLGDAVENCEALVTEIDDTAEGDADGLGGRQRYMLRAHLKGRDVGSLTLRYESAETAQAVDSEPANAIGSVALLQRHAEGAMRLMVSSFGGVVDSYRQQITTQQALIQEYQKQAAESFRLQEALASRKIEQKLLLEERRSQQQLTAAHEMAEIEKKEMLWKKGMAQVFDLAPVVVHYLTNGKAGEQPDKWRERQTQAAAEDLIANASDEDIENLRKTMSPDDFAVVMERISAHRGSGAANGPPRPTAPASSPPRNRRPATAREDFAGLAERLYTALASDPTALTGLANDFLGQRKFNALDAKAEATVTMLAAALAEQAPEVEPHHLWEAILQMQVAALVPTVEAIQAGTGWVAVKPEVKLQLMRIVRAVLGLANGESDEAA